MDSHLGDLINKACGQLSTSSNKRCLTFAEFQQKEKVKYVGVRYGGEFGDDPLWEFEVDGEVVEVGYNSVEKFWYVIWNGVVGYDGNLSGLKKRYPMLRRTGHF